MLTESRKRAKKRELKTTFPYIIKTSFRALFCGRNVNDLKFALVTNLPISKCCR